MKHYYKIEEPFEIRMTILYTLLKADRALTPYELSHIVLSSAQIDFFDIHEELDFLLKADEIYTFKDMENKTLCALTPLGKAGAESFLSDIPLEVREYADEALEVMFKEQRKKNAVICKCVPVNFDEFEAQLELNDDKKNLMSLNLYAGDEELAKKFCKNFQKNKNKIYDTIISMLNNDED